MRFLKAYCWFCVFLVYAGLVYGMGLPYLFSEPDSYMVVAGMLGGMVSIPVTVLFLKVIWDTLTGE